MTEHFFEECIPELLVFDEKDDFEDMYQKDPLLELKKVTF